MARGEERHAISSGQGSGVTLEEGASGKVKVSQVTPVKETTLEGNWGLVGKERAYQYREREV